MIGLYFAIVNWEATFNRAFRDPNSTDKTIHNFYLALNDYLIGMVMVTTLISIMVNYYKHATKRVWHEYKDPIAFYKKLVQKQVSIGSMDEKALTENFKIKSGFLAVLTDRYFLFELFLLLLIPWPIEGAGKGFFTSLSPRFTMSAINWTMGSILHA